MSREIPLTQGHVALVDDGDYAAVTDAGRWHAQITNRTVYAYRKNRRDGKWRAVAMHTFLTGWALTDHANGNGLDNRRANLRQCTPAQNAANSRLSRRNTSGYKGVSRNGTGWQAYVQLNGSRDYLGSFATPEQAAQAYDTAAVELFGEYARINFPALPAP